MPVLPALIKNRTTKTNNDIVLYANLGVGRKIGTIAKTASGYIKTPAFSCGGAQTNPSGGFAIAVAPQANKGTVNSPPYPDGLPALAPLFSAIELNVYDNDINAYSLTLTNDGDSMDIYSVPDPANDFLICYDQGFQATFGNLFRAIPRKYEIADHYVRQRAEGTLSLSDMMVGNYEGLQRLRGIPCTIIAKMSAGGTGVWSEIQYYGNCMLTGPALNTAADGNASVESQGQGNFSYCGVFSPNE